MRHREISMPLTKLLLVAKSKTEINASHNKAATVSLQPEWTTGLILWTIDLPPSESLAMTQLHRR
jgi:hypothetical protein